jgi:hypothetical protein
MGRSGTDYRHDRIFCLASGNEHYLSKFVQLYQLDYIVQETGTSCHMQRDQY